MRLPKRPFLEFERRLEEDKKIKESFHFNMNNLISNEFLENTIKDNRIVAQNFLTTFMVMKEGGAHGKGAFNSKWGPKI